MRNAECGIRNEERGIRPYVIVAISVYPVGDDAYIVPQNDGR